MDFIVSVVTGPSPGLSVAKDVELAKLGLLYADKVEISSPTLYYILGCVRMATLTGRERIEFVKGLLPSFPQMSQKERSDFNSLLNQYSQLKNRIKKTYQDIQIIQRIEAGLENSFKTLEQEIEKIFKNSGAQELITPISDGRIEFKKFSGTIQDSPQIILDNAISSINNELVYPLFDNSVTQL